MTLSKNSVPELNHSMIGKIKLLATNYDFPLNDRIRTSIFIGQCFLLFVERLKI